MNICAISTLNNTRSRKFPLPTEKEMRKEGRGTSVERIDTTGRVIVAAWCDNRRVLMLSNFIGREPLENCRRYNKKKRFWKM